MHAKRWKYSIPEWKGSYSIHQFAGKGLPQRIGYHKKSSDQGQRGFVVRIGNSKLFINVGPHDVNGTSVNIIYHCCQCQQRNDVPS